MCMFVHSTHPADWLSSLRDQELALLCLTEVVFWYKVQFDIPVSLLWRWRLVYVLCNAFCYHYVQLNKWDNNFFVSFAILYLILAHYDLPSHATKSSSARLYNCTQQASCQSWKGAPLWFRLNSKRVPSAGQMMNCPVIVKKEQILLWVLFVQQPIRVKSRGKHWSSPGQLKALVFTRYVV